MDLKNFFPTISYPRIKGLFAKQGYGNEVATLLALLCSEPETETVEMDGQRYYIHNKQRYLPQGAPSSPMISNILCRRLDARLQGLATKYDFVYTRYADDLTFSSSQTGAITALLNWTKSIVKEEGFVLHPDKTRIMHQGARQEVTGIVVNNQLSVNRKQLKQFRALLFQIKKDGYAGKQWGNKGGDLLATISGFAHYVKMVNPSKGKQFLHQIEAIKALHGRSSADHNFAWSDTDFRQKAANAELPLATMQVAQAPPVPDINSIIQHRDVLDSVKKELGIEEEVATKSPALSASIAKQDSDHTQKQQKTIFSRIKSWFGGAS